MKNFDDLMVKKEIVCAIPNAEGNPAVYLYDKDDLGVMLMLDSLTGDVSVWDKACDFDEFCEYLTEMLLDDDDLPKSDWIDPLNGELDTLREEHVNYEDEDLTDKLLKSDAGTKFVINYGDNVYHLFKLQWSENIIYILTEQDNKYIAHTACNTHVLTEDSLDVEEILRIYIE